MINIPAHRKRWKPAIIQFYLVLMARAAWMAGDFLESYWHQRDIYPIFENIVLRSGIGNLQRQSSKY
jgi:hypothetical protein